MKNHVDMVVFNLEEMLYLVLGEGIPTQLISTTEMDEWSSVVDDTGEPVWDIQIWEDLDRNPTTGVWDVPMWGCQYVNLVKLEETYTKTISNDKGEETEVSMNYHMGDEWHNPTEFIMTETPIAVVIQQMKLTVDIETENI